MILYNVKDFKLTYKRLNERYERLENQRVGFNFTRGTIGDPSLPNIDINKKLPIGTPFVQCKMYLHESLVWEFSLQIELDGHFGTKEDKKFKHFISSEVISQLEVEKNFTIKCHGESFQFNKSLLSMMSEVFKQMVCGNSKEAKSNCVEIKDFAPETIRAFGRVAFGDESIKNEDLTTDLLMFANKYFMKPLMKKCRNNLILILNNDNLGEIVKVAYHIDDEELLKVCAKHLLQNKAELNNTEEWKHFAKANADCMNKVCQMMFFDN